MLGSNSMAQYVVLFFQNASDQEVKIEKWSCEEGDVLALNAVLLTYTSAGKSFAFKSPVNGTLKVQLYPEGQSLSQNSEIAVLSVEDQAALSAVKAGYGKIIKPEELDDTIAHAEAASIRLPPQ